MSTPFTPPPHDGAIQLLRAIFGPVIDTVVGSVSKNSENMTTMLSEAFRFFNSGVLIFGTFLLTAVTLMGITNTANDGEALGKKWSTLYTPLRTLTATSMLVPSGSGYAGIQIVVLFIICCSVGFASNLWASVVKYAVGDDVAAQAISSVTNDPRFEAVALGALRMQTCATAVNQAVNATNVGRPVNLAITIERDAPSSATSLWPIGSKSFLGTTLTYRTRIFFKDLYWSGSDDICGQIIFTDTFDAPATTSSVTADVARSLQQAITVVRQRHIENLFLPNEPIGNAAAQISAVAAGSADYFDSRVIRDALDRTRAKFTKEVIQEISQKLSDQNSSNLEKLSGSGWIYAGSVYLELARIKDAVRNSTTANAEYVEGRSGLKGLMTGDMERAASSIFDVHMTIMAAAQKKVDALPVADAGSTPRLPVLATGVSASDFTDGGNGVKTMITSWTNRLSTSLLSGMVHHMSNSDQNPVLKVKNIGDWLSSSAMAIIVSQATLGASLEGLKDGAAAESNQQGFGIPMGIMTGYISSTAALLGKCWAYLSTPITVILHSGHFLGSWVPLIPYFVFSLGVVGWVVFVGEMLVASVIWMVAHLTPSTDGSFIGSQAQGYMLLASGFFRPVLMVLGLVFSMVVLGPVIQFIDTGFILAVRSTQADAVTGLFSLASLSLCYCFLISAVFALIFSLPQTFPDRILRWVGGGIGDMGEQQTMSRLETGASNQARAAAIAGAAQFAANSDRARGSASKGEDRAEKTLSASLEASAPEGISGQSISLALPSDAPVHRSTDTDLSPEF